MRERNETSPDRLLAVATLLVPFALMGQGCEKQRTGRPVGPATSSAATVESASAPSRANAPVRQETASSRSSAGTPRQGDRPAAPPERTTGIGPVEATVVTDVSFADFTADGVRLVDFWSPRCPPCRAQGPIVEKLAEKFAGRAAVGKLRVDLNREAPGRFEIMYIPTLVVFKSGEEVKRFTGLQNEATLTAALEEALRGE